MRPSAKFAITRSTWLRPSMAILEAAHFSPKTTLASRDTDLVVAISTSIGRSVPAQMRLTSVMACRAAGPVMVTFAGHLRRRNPSSSMVSDSNPVLSSGRLTSVTPHLTGPAPEPEFYSINVEVNAVSQKGRVPADGPFHPGWRMSTADSWDMLVRRVPSTDR